MPKKFFSDFENERVYSTPRGLERLGNGTDKELVNYVVNTRSQKSLSCSDPNWDAFADQFGAYPGANDRHTAIATDVSEKGLDFLAVACITEKKSTALNQFGLHAIDTAKAGGGFGFRVRASLGRLYLVGPLNNIIHEHGGVSEILKTGVPFALRLRIDNTGANQEVMYKAWQFYTAPEPDSWLYRGIQNSNRGTTWATRYYMREHYRTPLRPESFDSQTVIDLLSMVELVTGTESAPAEAGGRRLVPVAKW